MAGFLGNLQSQGRQVALGLGGTLAVAMVGLVVYAFVTSDSHDCAVAIHATSVAVSSGQWDDAREPVRQAALVCGSRRAEWIASMAQQIKSHDVEAAKIADAQKVVAATEAKRIAAHRESVAATDWPSARDELHALNKAASRAIDRGSQDQAAQHVADMRAKLDSFKGTSIEATDAWVAFNAKTVEHEAKVKPYVDKLNAAIESAKGILAAGIARDRSAGYVETLENFVTSTDLSKVQKAAAYLDAGDQDGFRLYVNSDPEIVMTRAHVRVISIGSGGRAGMYAHVRVKDTLTELWINQKGLAAF